MSVTLESLFSAEVSQIVPPDHYAPEAPDLSIARSRQISIVNPELNFVRLEWTASVNDERNVEYLGVADGTSQEFETLDDPVVAGYVVKEVALGASTTLSASAAKGATTLSLTSVAGLSIGDFVVINKDASDHRDVELVKIDNIVGSDIEIGTTLPEGINRDHASAETVHLGTVTDKTETTDYTIVTATGDIDLIGGQFTNSNLVFIDYLATNDDFDAYKVYRHTADDFSAATFFAGKTGSGATTEIAGLGTKSTASVDLPFSIGSEGQAAEGETFYFWVTAVDVDGNESRPAKAENALCDTGAVDTVPSVPTNLYSIAAFDMAQIFWDEITSGNSNLDGFDVYRMAAPNVAFDDATAVKMNVALISNGTDPNFEDSAENANRVGSGTAAYPDAGNTYRYKVTSIDSASSNMSTGSTRQGNVVVGSETEATKTIV